MKKIFVAVMAMAAFAACSNEEQIAAPQGQEIAFGDAFVDNSVRATDPSYGPDNELEHFNVYGTMTGDATVNIYDGLLVSKGGNGYGVAWNLPTGTTPRYWVDGTSYKFAAVVDADAIDTTDTGEETMYGMPRTLTWVAANQKDMLYNEVSYAADAHPTDGLVEFTFDHLLSKAKFTVTNSSWENTAYTYKITNIKITNAITEGVYTIKNGKWTATSANGQAFSNVETLTNGAGESEAEVLLVPGIKPVLSVTVELYFNGTKVKTETTTFNSITTVLEANKAYKFALAVGLTTPISFTVHENLDGWVDGGEINQ